MKPSTKPKPNRFAGAPFGSTERLLLTLDEIEGHDLDIVGGKAYRLALLRRHKIEVLPGLVLTSYFFEQQIRATRLTPLWTGSPDVAVTAEVLNWLADTLKAKPLDKELADLLDQRLTQVFGSGANTYAVRSSVIDEDQRDRTFAGIHRTELGVPRAMLPVAITRCWASALSGPAIKYRQVHGMSIQAIRVALLIQPMVRPEVSGVAFTANPLTGARDEIIVEAVPGLSDTLMSGEVRPDFYKLAPGTAGYAVIEHEAGSALTQSGPAELLTAQQLATLGQRLEHIQALMGDPQDVEWTYQQDHFNILQTRPVAMKSRPQPQLNQEWSRVLCADTLPELPSPLLASLRTYGQPQLRRYLSGLGFELAQSGPYEKFILGRPYLNLTMLKEMLAQLGLSSGQLFRQRGDPTTTGERQIAIDWGSAWQARQVYWAAWREMRGLPTRLDELAQRTAALSKTLKKPEPAASFNTSLAQFRRQIELYGDLYPLGVGLQLAFEALTGLGSRLLAGVSATPLALMTDLVAASLTLEQDKFYQALHQLGQALRDSAYSLTDYPDYEALPADVKARFKQVLAAYETRATYPSDPAWPRYQEQPDDLLALARQLTDLSSSSAAPDGSRRALKQLPPWRAQVLRLLAKRAWRLRQAQERWRELEAAFITALRRWGLGLGQVWFKRGWLNSATDIFWLTLEEIERVLTAEAELAHTLSATVSARQETYRLYRATTMPLLIKEADIAALRPGNEAWDQNNGTPEVTVGQPISPGQARGTVQVVRQPADFEPREEAVILVMASTAPAWLALLHAAAGLIVETGGLLSHGSVIAREYGLPAVANVPQATQRFRTGDKVLVDGSTGVVQLLEAGPSPPSNSGPA
jgi:pyruvate,water dikinase